MELRKHMSGLSDWNKLQNEVGPWNDFSIVRGKENIILGSDVWVGYFCLIDGSGGLQIGDKVSISSGVNILTHDSSNYRQFDFRLGHARGFKYSEHSIGIWPSSANPPNGIGERLRPTGAICIGNTI